MRIKRFDQIGKYWKPVGQIAQGGVAGITGITVFVAPVLSGLIILCKGPAGGFQFRSIDWRAMFGKRSAVEAGDEKGFYAAHVILLTEAHATVKTAGVQHLPGLRIAGRSFSGVLQEDRRDFLTESGCRYTGFNALRTVLIRRNFAGEGKRGAERLMRGERQRHSACQPQNA
jgi:hypothetical protein